MRSLAAIVVVLALAGCDDDPACNCRVDQEPAVEQVLLVPDQDEYRSGDTVVLTLLNDTPDTLVTSECVGLRMERATPTGWTRVLFCAQPEPPHWLRIDAGSRYDLLARRYNPFDPFMPPGMYRATVELERRRERVVLITISTPSFWLLAN